MIQLITDKITEINHKVLECLDMDDEKRIVTTFTELATKVLDADYGFVWLDSHLSKDLKLVYKSPDLPFEPHQPKKSGRNYSVLKSFAPDYVSKIQSKNDRYHVSKYIKSFVIIPLTFKTTVYGTMVLCYRDTELFSKEKRVLSVYIGNSVAQAITIHRLIEQQRDATRISAEREVRLEESRLRTEFIANATHEIRTPLAIIRGNADLSLLKAKKAMKTNTGDTSRAFIGAFKAINHEIDHLSNIISDLALLTSKGVEIENGVSFATVDLEKVIENVVKRCQTLAAKKQIKMKAITHGSLLMSGDRAYLERLLLNLVRNSVNYGRTGGWIKIIATAEKGIVRVVVTDNGIGISTDDLPYIFNRFYRADKARSSDGSSTGLGLAIAKWIVSVHHGNISVESVLGKGSAFTVEFPTLKSS